jgi:cation diffusion facilitator family transporter
MNTQTHRYQQTKRVTVVGAIKNIILGTLKVFFGVVGKSHALLADGLHSFSDLLTDLLVVFAARFSSQEADANHPYGHQRIETAASMFLALLLILTGLAIGYDAIKHLFDTAPPEKPDAYVWIVALISILFNEFLFHYTHRIGKKVKSELLIANAWHHRSDAASSLVVLVGILAALLGFHGCDLIAAAIVGAMIIKMGAELAWSSISELVDTGVPIDTLSEIEKTIANTPGVIAIHQLRTRSMGGAIFVDVHVLVNSPLSVSEGHYIAEKVHESLIDAFERVEDVTVHVDSEDDATIFDSLKLPSREELLTQLEQEHPDFVWKEHSEQIVIHYLQGKIFLEVFSDTKELNEIIIQQLLTNMPILGNITLYNYSRGKK